jgi:hypothetical protein
MEFHDGDKVRCGSGQFHGDATSYECIVDSTAYEADEQHVAVRHIEDGRPNRFPITVVTLMERAEPCPKCEQHGLSADDYLCESCRYGV